MKTKFVILMLAVIVIMSSCTSEPTFDKVWRIKSIVGAGDSESTVTLNYDKASRITSIEQDMNGLVILYYPSQVGNTIVLNYEGTNGAAERVFTFSSDSALMSIYDEKATDINRKFFYDEFGRMAGYYRSKANGDTTSLRKFLWSGNEIPNLISYGYTDGIRDQEGELVNMISEEVINPTFIQFPVELSAVLFTQEEFLMYGLANPAKFQMKAENTLYSDLQFDSFGHWTGYTRDGKNVVIEWEEAAIEQ